MSTRIATLTASSTARKVVGSLGVVAAAATVAGMGTFGTFTDSTTPLTTTISTGTVDIDLSGPAVSVPVNADNFVPGDSVTGIVDLSNIGTSALGSVSLTTTSSTSTVLTTDITNGLQLTLRSCDVAWSLDKTCAAGETLVSSGPAVGTRSLANAASLAPAGVDHLAYTVSLPVTADNTFQGLSTTLSLTFTGTQRTATAS